MNIASLIKPVGILCYLALLIVAVSGLMKVNIKVHKTLASIAVGLATVHAGILAYFFLLKR